MLVTNTIIPSLKKCVLLIPLNARLAPPWHSILYAFKNATKEILNLV